MIKHDVKKSQFYCENTENENEKYFNRTQSKFYHNIDTFYYTVSIEGDSNENINVNELVEELKALKVEVRSQRNSLSYQEGLMLTARRFTIYEYNLTDPDRYDIFISDYLPNLDTPRIVVQLRSFSLWLDGIENVINESCKKIECILDKYDLKIKQVRENRIDYAYHTNAIQDPYHHFSDRILEDKMVTQMEVYHKIGNIRKRKISLDYLALGQLKSNNVFIRIYNKGREVIEQGYKPFFFDLWYQNGLISFYDKYCYEYAYKKQSYNALEEAKLMFYLEHGHDNSAKNEITLTLSNKNVTYDEILELSNALMPRVTLIMNIEFQTKRKFYYSCEKYIETFLEVKPEYVTSGKYYDKTERLIRIVHNRKKFLDYLNQNTLTFIDKDEKTLNWWKRLQNLKIDCVKLNKELMREYNYKLDLDKLLKRITNSIATSSIYKNNIESDFIDDFTDLICSLNDNDVHNSKYMLIGNSGEMIDNIVCSKLDDYKKYKEKKYETIKNRLPKMKLHKK